MKKSIIWKRIGTEKSIGLWWKRTTTYTFIKRLGERGVLKNENGEIIWTASIPDGEENEGFTHLKTDNWEITNIE